MKAIGQAAGFPCSGHAFIQNAKGAKGLNGMTVAAGVAGAVIAPKGNMKIPTCAGLGFEFGWRYQDFGSGSGVISNVRAQKLSACPNKFA
ncbi:MAG: hypothetical protein ACK5KM_05220 [Hyphomicrobiaceae bacterium]